VAGHLQRDGLVWRQLDGRDLDRCHLGAFLEQLYRGSLVRGSVVRRTLEHR